MKRVWAFYSVLPVLLLTVLFAVGFGAPTAAAPGTISETPIVRFDVPADAPDPNETLRLVNIQRGSVGLPALVANEKLGALAKARAKDMAARHYYAHKDPDGKYYYDYFPAYNLVTGYNCENLDLVFVPNQALVIQEWNASVRGHKRCMENSKTTQAGYATTRLTMVDFEGKETTAYLVVAIHAEL